MLFMVEKIYLEVGKGPIKKKIERTIVYCKKAEAFKHATSSASSSDVTLVEQLYSCA